MYEGQQNHGLMHERIVVLLNLLHCRPCEALQAEPGIYEQM